MHKALSFALLLGLLVACGEQETRQAAAPTTEEKLAASTEAAFWVGDGPNADFYALSQRLDLPAERFHYQQLGPLLDWLIEQIDSELSPLFAMGDQPAPDYEALAAALGLRDFLSAGASVATRDDMLRTRHVAHLAPEPRGLAALLPPPGDSARWLALAPDTSSLVSFAQIDPATLRKAFEETRTLLDYQELRDALDEIAEDMREELGVGPGALYDSLDGAFLFLAEFDKGPEPDAELLADPGIPGLPPCRAAAAIGVRDATLYDTIVGSEDLTQYLTTEEAWQDGRRALLRFERGEAETPWTLALFQREGQLLLTSPAPHLERLLEQEAAGGRGILDNPLFQTLTSAAPDPAAANLVAWFDPALHEVWKRYASEHELFPDNVNPEAVHRLLEEFLTGRALVARRDEQGWLAVSNRMPVEGGAILPWDPVTALLPLLAPQGAPLLAMLKADAGESFALADAALDSLESEPARVSRAKADLRSLATAIEAYNIDFNSYPPSGLDGQYQAYSQLTTPIAYMVALPTDPFSPGRDHPYRLLSTGSDWLAWSPGPDGVPQIDPLAIPELGEEITPRLIDWTYDPSNGTDSPGDIWRRSLRHQ